MGSQQHCVECGGLHARTACPKRPADSNPTPRPTTIANERRRLCEAKVTLDGKPAVIGGVQNRFATVAQVPDGLSYEWAWDTVANVVARGGQFKS